MNVDFKKLLHHTLRPTKWGDLISVVQDILLNDIKPNLIDRIFDQFDTENMTTQDFFDVCNFFGYDLFSHEGYGESEQYFKRQVQTLSERIEFRNVRRGHFAVFYIYNLIGIFYPLYENQFDNFYLYPILDWRENNEIQGVSQTLDQDPVLTLDSPEFLTLDFENEIDTITRHMVFNYSFKNLESSSEWFSDDTMALYERDIKLQIRKTEVPYFEPSVNLDLTPSGITNVKWFDTYDKTDSGVVQSVFYQDDLSQVAYIHFGSGIAPGVVDGFIPPGVTDVELLSDEYTADRMLWDDLGSGIAQGRIKIEQKQKINSFKELALLDSSSGVIMYATFPEFVYTESMYCNVYLNINEV